MDVPLKSWVVAASIACSPVGSVVAASHLEPQQARPSRSEADPDVSPTRDVALVDYVPTKGEPTDADATDAEVKALREAAKIVNVVKSSACFRKFMADRKLIEANGRTSDQVAAHLQALRGTVRVAFYHRCNTRSSVCAAPTSAVAYRQPPEEKVFINRAYFDVARSGFNSYELAGTLAHEGIGHLLGGYGHSFEWTPSRDFSVPYSISGASHANADAFQHCRPALGF
jgi:hypothetical protein